MTAILNLKPEDEKRLHPVALKWFDDQSSMIERQTAIDGLTNDDLEIFLSDDEKGELAGYKNEMGRWLDGCITSDAASPHPPANASIGYFFMLLQVNSFPAIENMKSLLRKVHARKAAARPEARKSGDEAERRDRAFQALNPPIGLARKFLNCPGDYERFEMSISGAIDAYLGAGEFYVYQEQASTYLRWLEIVEQRQQEEARKLRAQSAADAYNRHLNEEMRELTTRLHRRKANLPSYFRATIQDRRYSGHSFDYLLTEEQKRDLHLVLVTVVNKQLEQLCSEDLRQFIVLPTECYGRYYPMPSAGYSFSGVPCLDFKFEVSAVAYAELWLKPGKKTFGRYEFPLPQIEEKACSVPLKRPRLLGYHYLILRPENLSGYAFRQSIPLILLKGLLKGEIRPEGATILEASHESVTYQVQGYEDKVKIPAKFALYLRSIGSIDGMVSVGIIAERVADVVKAELANLKEDPGVLSPRVTAGDKNTLKAKAFHLYSRGKRPGDPEVKGLGIRPETAYRYYQEWKKPRT